MNSIINHLNDGKCGQLSITFYSSLVGNCLQWHYLAQTSALLLHMGLLVTHGFGEVLTAQREKEHSASEVGYCQHESEVTNDYVLQL